MKRFLVIPLMLLYLLAVSGLRINLHFCGSSISSWNVFAEADDCYCEKPGKKKQENKKHDCCSDETLLAKVEQDHNGVASLHFDYHPLDAWMPGPLYQYISAAVPVTAPRLSPLHRPNAPPGLWQDIPLYKLHQRFTYYG